MAQFRGTVKGNRCITSRLGSKISGLVVEGYGWQIGAKIVLSHEEGKDVIKIYRTDNGIYKLIAEWEEEK